MIKNVDFSENQFIDILSKQMKESKNSKYVGVSEELSKVRFSGVDTTKTFTNFHTSIENKELVSRLKDLGNKEKDGECVFIHGNPGIGKTHLINACANEYIEKRGNLRLCLMSSHAFVHELLELIETGEDQNFVSYFVDQVDLLLVDDIQELDSPQVQHNFFQLFSLLLFKGKTIVLTSDRNPLEIQGMAQALNQSLSTSEIFELYRPNYESRVEIIKLKAQEFGIPLDNKIISILGKFFFTNVRQIEGMLNKFKAFSEIGQDCNSASRALELGIIKDLKSVDEKLIIKLVAKMFKIKTSDLLSSSRKREVINARSLAMYLMYLYSDKTYKAIGEVFSNLHHSSVISGVVRAKEKIKNIKEVSLIYKALEESILKEAL